jgi:hypothetical protein
VPDIDERRSTLRVTSAGSIPKRILVKSETISVKANTRPSRGTCATGRKCSGKRSRRPRRARMPMPMPAAPPMRASRRFSIQNCLWIC